MSKILPDLSATAKLEAQIQALTAKLAQAQAKAAAKAQPRPFSVKAVTSGSGRVYFSDDTGHGRPGNAWFYRDQWDAFVENLDEVQDFVDQHPELS